MLLPCERVCQPQWWRFLSNPRPVQPEPARPTGALFKINLYCSTVTFQCRVSFRRPAKRISHPCTGVPSCLTVCLSVHGTTVRWADFRYFQRVLTGRRVHTRYQPRICVGPSPSSSQLLPLGVPTSVLYMCVFISALQKIRSSLPFF